MAVDWLHSEESTRAGHGAHALAQAVAGVCFGQLALAGLVLALRRVNGALVGPLPLIALAGWACLLAAAAVAFRGRFAAGGESKWGAWVAAVPAAVLVLWLVGLSAGATAGGWLVLGGVLVAEEAWSLSRLWLGGGQRCSGALLPSGERTPPAASDEFAAVVDQADEAFDAAVSQQVVRRRDNDGGETLAGWIAVEVPCGARLATAHVAICPPFGRSASCLAEPGDGPPAQVKVAQLLPQGARFEIKLDSAAAEDSRVVVEFSIHDPPATAK